MDAATAARDLHVGDAGRAQLLLLVTRATEYRVRVRVDEAGREHAAVAIDECRERMRTPQRGLRSDVDDRLGVHEHGDLLPHRRVGHLASTASTTRTGAGDDLPRVDEQQLPTHARGRAWPITSRTRERRSGAWASPRQA